MSPTFFQRFCRDYYFFQSNVYESFQLSPDGKTGSFVYSNGKADVFQYDEQLTQRLINCPYPCSIVHVHSEHSKRMLFLCEYQGHPYSCTFSIEHNKLFIRLRQFNRIIGFHSVPRISSFHRDELPALAQEAKLLFQEQNDYRLLFTTGIISQQVND